MASSDPAAPRQHAYTDLKQPQLAEHSHAERARTLVSITSIGTLSTMSRRHAGFPFGSLMPFALDPRGRPIFLVSNMAMHTQNLKADLRASLFVGQPAADGDALGAARATLVGEVRPVLESDLASVREYYLKRHENSRFWVDFADFSFFRLEPVDIYYVGGFGVMGWVLAKDYREALPDPLAITGPEILAHMNADHAASMILLAKAQANIEATEAVMTSIDRLGFFLRLNTAEGMKGSRINFLHQVANAEEAREVLIEMVRQAGP